MKNISLIVNIVLAVALGVLFVLHFSLRSKVNEAVSHKVVASGNSNIVFVNMDSLYAKYNEYADLKEQLQKKQSKMEADINNRKIAYERKVADYQDKAQKGLLLTSERQRIEQQLMGEQQELMQYGQKLQNELAEESRVLNNKLGNNIIEFLKEYNKDGRFQFVLSHVYGGNLLYVNDSLDITKDVIEGLNKKYDKEKK
ncbi:MAG TPA: OmpH family outer membrane protein [Bacteroidales bacterium]|nr:OmpH family outer membrane protein [Bacteroidales bacterium]